MRYFEDFSVGEVHRGGPVAIDAAAIKAFAAQYDPQPFHLDETAAALSLFHGLVASGWQTASLTMRMMVDALGVAGRFIGLEVEEMCWPLAVRPGDVLRVEIEIVELRPLRSRSDYGLAKLKVTTLNQLDQPVQHARSTTMIARRG